MNVPQFVIRILLTFVAAFLGAFLTRRTEQAKHIRELRSVAYADFQRGFAMMGRAQKHGVQEDERKGEVIVADARARILIYGGRAVVHALATWVHAGGHTGSSEAQ